MDVDSPGPCRLGRAARSTSNHHRCGGLTLLELLVAIAVASILLGAGVPAFQELLQDTRMTSHINGLSRALHLARSEALKRRSHVVVCVSGDGETCAAGGGWEQGWLVFHDGNGNRDRDLQEPVVLPRAPLNGNARVRFSTFGSRRHVVVSPDGFTRSSNGTFTFCDSRGPERAKALILSKTGRLRVSRTKADGTPLSCPEN